MKAPCLSAHLYERREIELSFQSAALAGDLKECVYWLLELCESGWIDGAWEQLWIAYYDFYAAHNPHFEGELMELMEMKSKSRKVPVLHAATALIGRPRTIGAWLLRQGAIARGNNDGSEERGTNDADDIESVIDKMLVGPVEAAEVLARFVGVGKEEMVNEYSALVERFGGEVGGACDAWNSAPVDGLNIMCALLMFVNSEGKENQILDLSTPQPDRVLVEEALKLLAKTKQTNPRDHLLLWRQYAPRREIGCLEDLPRAVLAKNEKKDALAESISCNEWLNYTSGCPKWNRALRTCGGKRLGDGSVLWGGEDAVERFGAEYDLDTEQLPKDVLDTGTNIYPRGTKKQWLKKVWNCKPMPTLWTDLLKA